MKHKTPTTEDHTRVAITYDAIPNLYAPHGKPHGFVPVYYLDGRQHGNTYSERHLDYESALAQALSDANDEASRFIGGWHVTVKKAKS